MSFEKYQKELEEIFEKEVELRSYKRLGYKRAMSMANDIADKCNNLLERGDLEHWERARIFDRIRDAYLIISAKLIPKKDRDQSDSISCLPNSNSDREYVQMSGSIDQLAKYLESMWSYYSFVETNHELKKKYDSKMDDCRERIIAACEALIERTRKPEEKSVDYLARVDSMKCGLVVMGNDHKDKFEYKEAAEKFKEAAGMEEAIAQLLEYAESKEAADRWESAASCWENAYEYPKAIEVYEKIMKSRPDEKIKEKIAELKQKKSEFEAFKK